MPKIRDNLEGVVYARTGAFGTPMALRAGDKVPDGVTVGKHLLAKKGQSEPDADAKAQAAAAEAAAKAQAEADAKAQAEAEEKARADAAAAGSQGQGGGDPLPEPPRSGNGSGVAAWREYADAIGVEYPETATRDEIVALVDEARA